MAAAAALLALAALGFLIWFLVTRSAGKQAWLASLAAVVAVVLPAWGTTVAMLTWVRKSRTAEADRARESGTTPNGRLPVPQLRPLPELDPFDLEVHPSVQAGTAGQLPVLPRYVPREHDVRLRQIAGQAATGASQLAVVVGGSSTGKTRACWEMLDTLRGRAPQWRLWHPIAPARPGAVLAGLSQIGPHTVVWLNEAQLYLDTSDDTGERVAAGLRELLRDPGRRPVLVVATLWPEYWDTLTTRAEPDRHAQARELLSGHNIDVPDRFSAAALSALAQAASTDPRLADAAAHAAHGQITQYLAGAPVLLDRYQYAPPAARALIQVAMDARRLGCGPHLPLALLEAAGPGYLTDTEWDQLDDDWLDQALTYAATPRNGIPGPLTRVRPRYPSQRPGGDAPRTGRDGAPLYRLADYLDQHGRRQRHAVIPPASFWSAAPRAQPADLPALGIAAHDRGLLRAAAQICKQACHRDIKAAVRLVQIRRQCCPADHRPDQWAAAHAALDDLSYVRDLLLSWSDAGEQDQVTTLAGRAVAHAALDNPNVVVYLLRMLRKTDAQDQVAALLARDPAAHAALDDPVSVASLLDTLREAGAQDQVAALLARDPAAHAPLDNPWLTASLLDALREAGAWDQVTALARRAAAHVTIDWSSIDYLLRSLRRAGAQDQVTALLARDPAVNAALDNPYHVADLLRSLREAGAQDQVAALLARDPAANAALNDPPAIADLLRSLRRAGAQDQVTALAARAAVHASLDWSPGVASLLDALRDAGAQDQVAALLARDPAAQVALSDPGGVALLLRRLREAGAQDQVTVLAARAAAHAALDNPYPSRPVASLLDALREAGAQDQVTVLAARAAAHASLDDPGSVVSLLDALRKAGVQDQVAVLLARDPAAHAALDRPYYVALLLRRLQEVGERDQATRLADRLPGEGMFDLFCAQGNNQALYRFGRDPDGSPARPWGWDDLN